MIDVIDAARDPLWEDLVAKRDSSVFHSPPWLHVLAETYDFPIRARVLRDETGAPHAGLVYAEVADFLDPRIAALPFSDFCDPLVTDEQEWHALTEDLIAQRRRIDLRCLNTAVPLSDGRFSVVDRAMWHGIDVQRDDDEIWRALPSSARRALRKARADGVEVKFAREEADLRAFFELHLRVRKNKYRLLAQPYRFFTNIWEQFLARDRGALVLAAVDGRPIAGCLFLEWQDTLYYKFNASDATYLSARPNDRVLWEGINLARDKGLERIDFGLTDADQEGLLRYKRKYATAEKTITMLRHRPDGSPSTRDRQGRDVLQEITRLFTDESVPDGISERAGEVLYRYFV